MDSSVNFPISLTGCRVEGLVPEDAARLQLLYEACADYAVMESGAPTAPDAAAAEFEAIPPNRTVADKFMFALLDPRGDIVGLLECVRGYPDDGCWWIGLLMLHPAERGRGTARMFFEAFADWAKRQGASRLELAVFDANRRADRFWRARGFHRIRSTEPRSIGIRTHVLHIMRLTLVD